MALLNIKAMKINPITVKKLTEVIGGNLLQGDPDSIINYIGQDGLLFCFSKKAYDNLNADTVVVVDGVSMPNAKNIITVKRPRLAFAKLLELQVPTKIYTGIDPSANIASSAIIAKDVNIGPNAVIAEHVVIAEDVEIGANTVIMANSEIAESVVIKPNVTIYPHTKIGSKSIVHSGAVIGADGFGYEPITNYPWYKIPHLGGVEIGQEVEIGAGTTIDRGTITSTKIASGVKIDNQCQIGHNVSIGANTIISGCTGIAGSTQIGKNVIIGGKSAISDHLVIADAVIIKGASTVFRDVKQPGIYGSAINVMPSVTWNRCLSIIANLPKIYKIVKKNGVK